MALGEAFVTAKADTKGFVPDLERKLKAALKGFEVKVKVVPDVTKFRTALAAGLKGLEPVKVQLAADVPGLIARLRSELKAAGVFIPVQLRADTTRLIAALKRDLRALPPIPIKVLPQLDTKALARAGSTAKKAADAMALHFRAAALDISQSMALMAASGIDAAERIAAASKTANQTLRHQFGVGASDVARRFDEAAKIIAQSLSAASASGEKSLIRLAQTAQRTADTMEGSLARAAALAAQEIQGPLRTAIDLIVKDLVELRNSGRITFADIDTAGKLAAERLAAAFGSTGKEMTSTIEAAAAKISAAIEAASASGVTSLEGLRSAAAIAAKQAGADFLRMSQQARLASAQIIRAGNEAGAGLKGALGTAAHLAAADLAKLAEAGVLTQADIAQAARVAANAISDEFGLHSVEALHGIALFIDRATVEFRRLALSGQLSAKEIEAEFLKAFADATVAAEAFASASIVSLETVSGTASTVARRVSASLNKLSDFAQRQFGRIASTAKTSFLAAAGSALLLGTVIGGIGIAAAGTVEQIKVAFEGIFKGQATQFQNQLADGTKRTAAEVQDLQTKINDANKDAANFFKDLQQFAKVTPFEFPELAKASQQLGALGLSGEKTLSVLTDIGDAVSTVGGGSDEVNRVTLAITQIASVGKVTLDNLKQISNALPNFNRPQFAKNVAELRAVEERGKGAKASVEELAQASEDLQNGGISASEGIAALLKTLREAPGALGAMERQMKTLKGQISNFKDNIRINLTNAFSEVGPTGVSALQAVSNALTPLGDAIASTFGAIAPSITNLVTTVGPELNNLLVSIGDAIGPILDVVSSIFVALQPALSAIIDGLGQVFAAIGPGITAIATAISDALLGVLPELTSALEALGPSLANLAPAFEDLLVALTPLLPLLVQFVDNGLKVLADILPFITPLLAALTNTLNFLAGIPGLGEILTGLVVAVGVLAVTLGPVSTAISGLITIMFGLTAVAAAAGISVSTLVIALGILFVEFVAVVAIVAAVGFAIKKLADHVGGFGNLVKITFNKIVGFVGFALKSIVTIMGLEIIAMIEIFSAFPRAVLFGFTKILKGLGHIPKWLGGGAFDTAASAVQDLLNTVNGAVDGLVGEVQRGVDGVNAAIDNITKEVQVHINIVVTEETLRNPDIVGPRTALGNEFQQEKNAAHAAAIAKIADETTKIKKRKPVVPSDFAGFDSAAKNTDTAAKKAADKIKETAKKFRDAIKAILDSLDSDFRNGLIHDTAVDIKKTLAKLITDIAKAFDEAGKKRPNKLIDLIRADSLKLQKLANERDDIAKKLEKANAKFTEVRDSVLGAAKLSALDFDKLLTDTADTLQKLEIRSIGVAGSFQVMGKAVKESTDAAAAAVVHTAADFAAALKSRKDQILQFQKDIAKLIKLGFDKDIIDQILTTTDFATASALAGASKATVKNINASQRAIETAANQLGNTAADQFFRQGGKIVEGLIAGLKDRKSEIVKEMTDIANALIAAIRKTLKIKSPSRVAQEIGGHFVTGLANGLDAGIVSRAGARAVAGLGNLSVPSVDFLANLGLKDAHAQLARLSSGGSVQRMHPEDLKAMTAALADARPHAAQKEIHQTVTVTAPLRERFTHAEATAHLNRIAGAVRH